MTSDQIASIAGIVLSLAFSYAPGLSTWFDTQDGTRKRLITGVVIIAVGIGAFVANCVQIGGVVCDQKSVSSFLTATIAALVANQAMYLVSPKIGGGSDATGQG